MREEVSVMRVRQMMIETRHTERGMPMEKSMRSWCIVNKTQQSTTTERREK
jgi:hypothetical protein